jgi:hypothetical protein
MTKKSLAIIFVAISLQSCATFSDSHPKKMSAIKDSFTTDKDPASQGTVINEMFSEGNRNTSVGYLEKGRFDQLINNNLESQQQYSNAISEVRTEAIAPIIRASKITQNSAAVLSSDKERDYVIPSYQITFLYAYQALNYLKQNSLEDAAVSIRNLSDAQDIKRKQEEQERLEREQDSGVLSEVFNLRAVSSYLASSGKLKTIDNLAQGVSNSYANPLAYYLEGIIYEAYDSDYNNALISMRNAKNSAPNNKYISKTFDSFNDAMQGGHAYPNNTGRLTVIYEQGFVSPMSKCDIGIPMSASFYTSMVFRSSVPAAKVSLPCYKLKYTHRMLPPVGVSVYSYGKLIALDNTSTLVDTLAMAAKSLQEDYPAILTREVLRFATKTISTIVAANAARQSAGDYGPLASLAVTMVGSAYQQLTTVADIRSWLLLPNNAQLFVDNMPAGQYLVNIGGSQENVNIKNGKNTLVWITSAGQYTVTQYNNFL